MKFHIFGFFLLIIPFLVNGNQVGITNDNPDGIYYVIAPSGLNLRVSSDAKSAKIGHIPYGEALELASPSFDISLEIDQILGGMADVNYKGKRGYVFDGYLSRFPASKEIETEAFVEQVRDLGYEVLFEEHRMDWGGYIQYETAFTLPGEEWPEAFLIAQQHFDIPKSFLFPKPNAEGEKEVTVENPKKSENEWQDSMTIIYDKNGQLTAIEYGKRAEGFGKAVTLSFSKENSGIRIAQIEIVD